MIKKLNVLITIGIFLAAACDLKDSEGASKKDRSFGPSIEMGGVTVGVDYRIEALAIGQLLADYQILTSLESEYKKEILTRFSGLKDHPLVDYIRINTQKGVAFEKPVYMVLLLGDDLVPAFELPDYVNKIVGGHDKYIEFSRLFAEFYKSTEFQQFATDKEDYFVQLVSNEADKIRELGTTGQIAEYYGYRKNAFKILISPLLHNGGYGPAIQEADSIFVTYNVMGPRSIDEEENFFFGDEEYYRLIMWHEFSHSYLNKIIDNNFGELSRFSSMFYPIQDQMEKLAYGSWKICMYEHLVRAATIRLTDLYVSSDEAVQMMDKEIERGFIYLPKFVGALEEYESNRDKYPVIDSIYPVLLEEIAK